MAHTERGFKKLQKMSREKAVSERVADILKIHNEKIKKTEDVKKRKSYTEMIELIGELYKPEYCLRSPESWRNDAYNEKRQLMSFVKHIYCKYRVPSFMFGIFDKLNVEYYTRYYKSRENVVYKITKNGAILFEWFIIATSGRSLAKEASDFFTKKEAHIFLNGRNDLSIFANYWRSKLIAAGATEETSDMCIGLFPYDDIVTYPFMYEAAKFFPRFQDDIDPMTLIDVMDYVENMARGDRNKGIPRGRFDFKGKTLKSLIKASIDWHRDQNFKVHGDLDLNFTKCKIDDWEWNDLSTGYVWYIRQILNSKTLYCEGRTLKHCVATYVEKCTSGNSIIFSLTNNVEGRKLTIEVNRYMQIVQARGKFNANPTGKERKILMHWAEDNGIKMALHTWR